MAQQQLIGYPLNKEEAHRILQLSETPEWQLFLRCVAFEAQQYANAALQTEYGPYAMEKFRFNQGLAVNIPRIPLAVVEAANLIANNVPDLNGIYDDLNELQ